jgi:hypothetical protein
MIRKRCAVKGWRSILDFWISSVAKRDNLRHPVAISWRSAEAFALQDRSLALG